ncbi:hypothetical protein [Pseudarthrobacter sp. ATCC 49987]|uniref:hypothetical protein n=1 Tax=Pseudarthrobacter sp. ATCC 49987 TaxID=2698204 RepID=UPI00136E9C4D|nr:hypothetical protein [Pseudarthrobacter sp. ATCC 49987]
MSTVESLVQSPSGQRQLRLIEVLSGLEPVDDHYQVDIEALEKDPEQWGFSSLALAGDLEAMKSWGWLDYWESLEGIGSVLLKQPGLDAANGFGELKSNRSRRAQHLRDAVLNWLYDQDVSGGHVSGISDFLESASNQYLGDPYSQDELYRATKWLLEEEYIKGHKASGGELIRPSVTTKGSRIVEAEQSVNQALTSAGLTMNNVTITDSQSVNVALQSSNVTQSNSMTQGQVEVVERILGSVRAMVNPLVLGVTEDVTTQAQIVANDVEEEIHSSAPDSGKVKALLLKLVDHAATGTVQGGIDALNAMMQQGIAGL